MNRWTGTGHLTKDPKFLETENGTAICTLRIAVKRAGKQGHDGYFDVKCFDAQASACAQYLKAGREVAVDGRLLFDEFQTQDGSYASRVYIVAERVEFLASRKPSNGQASDEASPDQPATRRRGARGPPGRLTTIAGPRRSTGRGPDDFHGDRHDHHDHHPPRDRRPVPRRARRHGGPRRAARAALPPRGRAADGPGLRPPEPAARAGDARDRARPAHRRLRRLRAAHAPARRPRRRRRAPSCCGPTATARTPSPRSSDFEPAPAIVIASGTGSNCHAYWPLTRAARARRGRAREPAARARARRRPRVRRRRADPARPRHAARTSTTRRPPVDAIRLDPERRVDAADVVGALPDPPAPPRARADRAGRAARR